MQLYLLILIGVLAVVTLVLNIVVFLQRKALKKNKCKYDLRNVRFELEPLDGYYVINFYCGKIIHSERFTEADLELNRNLPFQVFVKWCEGE